MVNNTSGFGDYENACLYQNIDASFGILYQPPFPLRRHNESMTSNYHFKIIGPKKRKWKLSHRTDTLVKSKYLIISIFS